MNKEKSGFSRRGFLKTAGIAGIGSMLSVDSFAKISEQFAQSAGDGIVPKRAFGKTGENVPILGLGGMFDIPSNQLLMKQAVKWGVTYWDTADCYEGGNSERGIGMYFEKYPEETKQIFLVTKSDARDPDGMSSLLYRSLERMKTSYVDLYFIHGISSIDELDNKTKNWVEKTKAAKKIRFFGFSTHSNMEDCMTGAARLGWIDGIMMTYNFRLMHSDRMKRAVEVCEKAGIGLTAMKTQGGGQVKTSSETELRMAGRFMKNGYTDKQARLKAVWENHYIASICSQMPSINILMSNASVAMDRTKFSSVDIDLFRRYAGETSGAYCLGCTNICESAVAGTAPVGNLMRCLMYSRNYNEQGWAREIFNKIPVADRERILKLDFSPAEQKCPQQMEIGKLIKEACFELS
ncbi:MAG: aldo/keto reductase [Desulfobacteraceae bacterium]|nr:MAG: aldo/keto reductase [Desulfobacteraceae bacterium]